MTLFTLAVTLFLIMDPIGNISPFLKVLHGLEPKKQRMIVIREMGIALAIMLLFSVIGEYIFDILEISLTTVRIASGTILFLFALKVLFMAPDNPRSNLPGGEPFVTPLAIPLIAGPALLATVMLFAKLEESYIFMWLSILLAWSCALAVLLMGPRLQRLLGVNGLLACEKLMGMILMMLAIQRFLEGVGQFVKACH